MAPNAIEKKFLPSVLGTKKNHPQKITTPPPPPLKYLMVRPLTHL